MYSIVKSRLLETDSKYLKGMAHLYLKSNNTSTYKHIQKMNQRPILIGGCGRSGTTLLLSILSSHPDIFAIPHETYAFCWSEYHKNKWFERDIPKLYKIHNILVGHESIVSYSRWCEKSPKNIRRIPQILKYFGTGARIINIVRDGRDVITSINPRRPGAYWVSPERWIRDVSLAHAYEGHPQVLTIKYEELIRQPEPMLRQICRFTNISYAREFDSYPEYATIKMSKAWFRQATSLHDISIGRWQTKAHKQIVEKLISYDEAATLLRFYGYS